MTFKTVVKAVASRNGLFASFMPKPILTESGSGLHINISLSKDGFNISKRGIMILRPLKALLPGLLIKYWILPHLQIR